MIGHFGFVISNWTKCIEQNFTYIEHNFKSNNDRTFGSLSLIFKQFTNIDVNYFIQQKF